MHRHIYRKKIFSALLILLFCFGFPTVITLVFGSKSGFRPGTSFVSSGRSIVLTTENTKETYDMEEFLPCLLMGQASIDDNEAFLEAFAIVLRTYVCQRLSGQSSIEFSNLGLPYLSYSDMQSDWGGDFQANLNKLRKIVKNTSMLVLSSDGTLLDPPYHPVSSGTTRQGSESYMRSVECQFDYESKDYLQTSVFSTDSFLNTFTAAYPDLVISSDNPLSSIQILARDNAGYVTSLQINGTDLDVSDFMNIFHLASACFELDEYNGGIRIITKGVGCGYGMSLFQAKKMAEKGKNYTDILQYFYTDAMISMLE